MSANRCVCCYSPAIQNKDGYYFCDVCMEEYTAYLDYYNEGQRRVVAVELSGFMGVDPEYAQLDECKVGR